MLIAQLLIDLVSQISALAGYHPYADLPEIFLTLVYQGRLGNLLQHRDAQLLGMSVVSKSENLMDIATRGGEEVQKILKLSMDIKLGKSHLRTIDEVKELKENVIKQARNVKDLSKNEIQQLIDGVSHNIHTGFGHHHEDNALDEYEKICGCTIRDRNVETKRWDFARIDDLETSLATVTAMGYPHTLKPTSKSNAEADIKTSVLDSNASSTQEAIDNSRSGRARDDTMNVQCHKEGNILSNQTASKPFFSILGSIDGLRDEPYMLPKVHQRLRESDDADNSTSHQVEYDDVWKLRTLVVECKHRMNRFYLPPPLYDQIQCIVYCLMYNTEAGEIVQVIRNKQEEQKPTEEQMASFPWIDWSTLRNNKKHEKPFAIRVSTVYLDDPRNNHRQNFFNIILPRLRTFVDAVYSYRRDDSKRFAFLLAFASSTSSGNDDEIWNRLFEECPYLLDCDTSFHRKRKDDTTKTPTFKEE